MTTSYLNLNLNRDIPLLCFDAHRNEESFREVMSRYPSAPMIFFGKGDSTLIQKFNYGLFAGDIPEEKLPEILNRTKKLIYLPSADEVNYELIKNCKACGCEIETNEVGNFEFKPSISTDVKVSVVIVAENEQSKIISSLKSVIAQTYPNIEVLLIDETDDYVHKNLIDCPEFKSVKYIHKPYGGVADCKNIGVASAAGEWIMTLPAGDLIKSNCLERMVKGIIDNPNAEIITSNTASVSGVALTHEPTILNLTYSKTLPDASLFKKSLWEEVGGFYEGLVVPVENWSFWIAAIRNDSQAVIIDEALIYTRLHLGNQSYNRSVVHSLFPDLFDVPVILAAHESLKIQDEILRDALLERISRFPWLTMPWMWLGLIEESLGSNIRAAKSYIRSVKNSGEENWQAMIRLHIVSSLLGKLAEDKGETHIAEERFAASDEFLEVAQQLIDEREKILAPDWPKPRHA